MKIKCQGFSLVELMVSSLAGVIILGGVLHVYSSQSMASKINSNLTSLQEDSRFAVELMSFGLRKAGFRNDQWDDIDFIYPNGKEAVRGSNDTGLNGSDVIVVRYQADNNSPAMENCFGEALNFGDTLPSTNITVASDTVFTEVYFLSTVDNEPSLMCGQISNTCLGSDFSLYSVNTGSTTENVCATTLVNGIEHMQVWYGVDANGDGSADQYLISDDVSSWNSVVSLRIGLLFRTSDEIRDAIDSKTYKLVNKTVTPASLDRRMRRIVTTTVSFRNLLN